MAQRTSGNPANGSIGDPIRNAIFRSPKDLASYVGVHGQIGFLLCAGNMRGVLFDGKTCGGVAHWPLFAAGTDFSNLYALVDGCLDPAALEANCEPTVVVNPEICDVKLGAELQGVSGGGYWVGGTLYGDASLTVTVVSGYLVVLDNAGAPHVFDVNETPVTGMAIGGTTGVTFTGTYTIDDGSGSVAECTVEGKPISSAMNVQA